MLEHISLKCFGYECVDKWHCGRSNLQFYVYSYYILISLLLIINIVAIVVVVVV